ncbi:hypothetical protein NOS3756_53880 [Nostoc sp. NIES-3756]|uniref:hypothetical protein n=1 Tax=Nostoc sp. NIES-3756 TaxID=1751286 RepID=UPI000720E0C9|nr:hypothetical protein [Nostoc sp. NIES-3756]BAT56383.1 hypothetical protein NOS3756_53880 [Nostoc sp. NIES-3756]
MELSLNQIFGFNAIQNGQFLILNKADFISLTANSSNTAESLLTAILLNTLENFQGYCTDENGNAITDEQNRKIDYDNSNLYPSLTIETWKPYTINRKGMRYRINGLIIKQYSEYADTEFS